MEALPLFGSANDRAYSRNRITNQTRHTTTSPQDAAPLAGVLPFARAKREAAMRRITMVVLAVLTFFLALTAFAGGAGLVLGFNVPPTEYLSGSPFGGYLLPGLALFVFVGGSALYAGILAARRSSLALLFSTVSGIVIMFFEFIEVETIGAPAGPARALQYFYFLLGTVITIVALSAWYGDLRSAKK